MQPHDRDVKSDQNFEWDCKNKYTN